MNVIDTSVVLKWFVAEEDSALAEEHLGSQLIAPDLILAELGNALWKKWCRNEIGRSQSLEASIILPDAVGLFPSRALADVAVGMAFELTHPVYDCFFLALADSLDCTLITADTRLIRKLSGTRFARMVSTLNPAGVQA